MRIRDFDEATQCVILSAAVVAVRPDPDAIATLRGAVAEWHRRHADEIVENLLMVSRAAEEAFRQEERIASANPTPESAG